MDSSETHEIIRLRGEVERLTKELDVARGSAGQPRAAAAYLDAVLGVLLDVVITMDDHGSIETVSDSVRELFGYEADELLGKNVKMLMPDPFRDEHDGYLSHYRETGEKRIIGIGREVSALRKDGTSFPIELGVSELELDGRRVFLGMIRDVTARKDADDRLRERHERLQSIMSATVDGILSINERGEIEEANAAAERIFGYSHDELIGASVNKLMPAPFAEEHDDYLRRYVETGEGRIIGLGREVRGRRSDGKTFPLYLAVSEVKSKGRRVFTGIVRDLQGLRDAELRAQQAEQLAAASTITAGIAHDVGTPMTTILGYAELMQKTVGDEKNRWRAEQIVEQVRRVTDLVTTLLNIARPREATPTALRLSDVLDHSLDFFREKLKGRGIVVERAYEEVESVLGDRDRLEQVFLNLIVNALDAMPEGGTLSVRLDQGTDSLVEIRISDSGIGIDPATLERVFEPFYTTKERGKGTGLGLLVSQRIIHDHGGMITAASEVGVGTEFTIQLPPAQAAEVSPG